MAGYYLSRAFISLVLGALLLAAGLPWWMALIATAAALAFFVWAPRGGRYAVDPEFGLTALRHDERTEAIRDRSVRAAFVAVMLALAAIVLHSGVMGRPEVPVLAINLALLLGILVYLILDAWQRRT